MAECTIYGYLTMTISMYEASVPRFVSMLRNLDAILAKTIAFVESFSAGQIDASEEREIALKVGGHELTFKGMPYLLGFALPNFYFHMVTAYNILRHNGVEIGKPDYIGNP